VGAVAESKTGSWRLLQSVERQLHVALYTRAVLDLPTGVGTPPPLRGGPDPVPGLLAGCSPAEAGGAWRNWWQWWDTQVARAALLRGADRLLGAPPTPPLTIADETDRTRVGVAADAGRWAGWAYWRERVSRSPTGPLDYDQLPPALRDAAVTTWGPGNTWTTRHVLDRRPRTPTELPLQVAAAAAAAVAFDHHVPLDAVRGVLFPLAVSGLWWAQWAPGVVLCSLDALSDPPTAQAVAYTTFAGPHQP